jgi:hypothetical protein
VATLHKTHAPALPVTNRLQKFLELALQHKLTLVQAWFLLGYYRASIILVPFKRITANLQHYPRANSPPALLPLQRDEAIMIGRLAATAARFTPWQSLCLTQVLVTQRLLARRSIPGQFYLGVRKGKAAEGRMEDLSGLAAHAWLDCGGYIVNGRAGHQSFTIVSAFSWGGFND